MAALVSCQLAVSGPATLAKGLRSTFTLIYIQLDRGHPGLVAPNGKVDAPGTGELWLCLRFAWRCILEA